MLSHPHAPLKASEQPHAGAAVDVSSLAPVLRDAAAEPRPCVRSDELLRGGREIDIAHGDAVYRLRVTALGRLILTK